MAGTTATFAKDPNGDPAIQRYPRRVAFLRYIASVGLTITKKVGGTDTPLIAANLANNSLVLDSDKTPIPLAIFNDSNGKPQVSYLPFSNILKINNIPYPPYSNANQPRTQSNTLWFQTRNSAASPSDTYDPKYPLWIANSLTGTRPTEQPLLIPVLQIQYPFIGPVDSSNPNDNNDASTSNNPSNSWMQNAISTETNVVFAQGNTPGRPVETNGGLENFVRYLERWKDTNHTASGAFIQFKRSSYATAPWQVVTATYNSAANGYSTSGTNFGYPQGYRQATTNAAGNLGRSPFYTPPTRFWGYDVALLSQLPDLFSQRFTTPTTSQPNEFYREVGRDDKWMKTLLCATENQSVGGYDVAPSASYGSNFKFAISQDQRPSTCP